MSRGADFRIERSPGAPILSLVGDWTTLALGGVADRLRLATRAVDRFEVEASSLGRVDTVGVFVLARAEGGVLAGLLAHRPELRELAQLVEAAMAEPGAPPAAIDRKPATRLEAAARATRASLVVGFGFYGRLLTTLAACCRNPRRLRLATTVGLMQRSGLEALPIIMATSFFVGATVAFLGATLLAQFGAQVFSVDLVGIGVLREFGVLVACIILAGRSGSSFAAEIAAMRLSQEVDAMQTLGVDPFETLVLPRVLAIMTMTPLLTVAAMIAGLAGGLLVIWSTIGLSPTFFINRLVEEVGLPPFMLGIIKAPVLAALISTISCAQGWRARGGVEELGRRVTAAVVQSLFALIIGDAAFAFVFTRLGY